MTDNTEGRPLTPPRPASSAAPLPVSSGLDQAIVGESITTRMRQVSRNGLAHSLIDDQTAAGALHLAAPPSPVAPKQSTSLRPATTRPASSSLPVTAPPPTKPTARAPSTQQRAASQSSKKRKKDTQDADDGTPFIFKTRFFSAQWQKENRKPKPASINTVNIKHFRMEEEATAPDQVENEVDLDDLDEDDFDEEDGGGSVLSRMNRVARAGSKGNGRMSDAGVQWSVTYTMGRTPKGGWTAADLRDPEQFANMMDDPEKTLTIWLHIHDRGREDADTDKDASGEGNTVRHAIRRTEANLGCLGCVRNWQRLTEDACAIGKHNPEAQRILHSAPTQVRLSATRKSVCYQKPPGGAHVPMNMIQIRAWSNALANPSNEHNDIENPPGTREFDIRSTYFSSSTAPSPARPVTVDDLRQLMHPSPPQSTVPVPGSTAQPVGPPTMFSISAAEDQAFLRMRARGEDMTVEKFCEAFELPDAVLTALRAQQIDKPDVLSEFPFELYRRPEEEDGFNLKIGPAYRLKKAVVAWKQGHSSKAEAYMAGGQNEGGEAGDQDAPQEMPA